MSGLSHQEQEMPFVNHPSPSQAEEEEQEEELLLLHQTTSLDSPSSSGPSPTNHFSHQNLHAFPSSSFATHSHLPCTNCGYYGFSPASHKRPSPEPPSSAAAANDHEQPKHKKPNNHLPSLKGFSKISLPTRDQPLLRPCSKDPLSPTNVVNNNAPQVLADPQQSPPQNAEMALPETPLSAVRASAAKLPPRAPPLRRSVSDPNPSPSNTFSGYCGTMGGYESPNDKRLRRMRDCVRKMSKWWDEILPEEEHGATAAINNNNNNATMENSEADIEESVSVERAGEFLVIHFKCPCGKGYQILISGKNCYYKLV